MINNNIMTDGRLCSLAITNIKLSQDTTDRVTLNKHNPLGADNLGPRT